MPRSSKRQPETPTGPRLVKRTAAKTSPSVQPDVTHEAIAMRAYEFFQQEGGVHGHHVDHWLRAEIELKSLAQQPPRHAAATRARG